MFNKNKTQSNLWLSEFSKYLVAGGMAFILDFSVFMICYKWIGIYYLTAAGIGLLVGMITSYFLSVRWVFKNRNLTNKNAELIIFIIIGIFGFLINEWSIWFFVEKLMINVPVSKLIATGIVFIWNFVVRKLVLFRDKLITEK